MSSPVPAPVEVKWTSDPDAVRRRRLAALLFGRSAPPQPPAQPERGQS